MNIKKQKKWSKWVVPLFALVLVVCSQEKSFLKSLNLVTVNDMVEKDSQSLQSAVNLQQTLRNIAKSISPAVVNIRTEKTVKVSRNRNYEDFFNDPFFRRFFGDRGRSRRKRPKQKQQSLGSGIIISSDGYIVSNNHVVAGADKITVHLSDKRKFTAKIIGTDEKSDIALIKIEKKVNNLPVAPLGNSSKIHVGDFAIAIGNPFGLNWTFTFGVISATGRNTAVDPNAPFKNYIQTDVSINPGNSGGPLLNINGQVVGINSAIYSRSGGSIGIGFAIPINIAKNVVKQLLEKGKVERGYIGTMIQDIDEKLAKYYNLDRTRGVLLTKIEADSPAKKAGLKSGDVVLEVNGEKVESANDLVLKISSTIPGNKVKLTLLRNGTKIKIDVTVGKRSEGIAKLESGEYWLGMKFGDLNTYKDKMNIPDEITRGIVLIEIKEGSEAENVGLQAGDIVDMINNKKIKNINSLLSFIKKNGNKKQFLMRIIRNGRIYFVVIENKK